MREQFSGLIIGGPGDGKLLTWQNPYYRVSIQEPSPMVMDVSEVEKIKPLKSQLYKHVNLEGGGFWVPEELFQSKGAVIDGKSYRYPYEFIIARLAACYRPPYTRS